MKQPRYTYEQALILNFISDIKVPEFFGTDRKLYDDLISKIYKAYNIKPKYLTIYEYVNHINNDRSALEKSLVFHEFLFNLPVKGDNFEGNLNYDISSYISEDDISRLNSYYVIDDTKKYIRTFTGTHVIHHLKLAIKED